MTGLPPDVFAAIARAEESRCRGDIEGEATARLELGDTLAKRNRYGMAVREFRLSAERFVQHGDEEGAAYAEFNAAVAHCLDHALRDSLARFAAAESHLDSLQTRQEGRAGRLDQVRLQVEAAWLEALIDLEGTDQVAVEPLEAAVLERCERLLVITSLLSGPKPAFARYEATYHKARVLARADDHIRALPAAREAAEVASLVADDEARAIERQMRIIMGIALGKKGERGAATDQLMRGASLAAADDDALTVDMAIMRLAALYRREQPELTRLLDKLLDIFVCRGADRCEARARYARARAIESTSREPDLAVSLQIVSEYLEAGRSFEKLGEIARHADSYYAAGHALSTVALLKVEHRNRALTLLAESEQLFRSVANWHGVGIALFGQAELLNRWYPGVERQDTQVELLQQNAVEVFRLADLPVEEAGATLMQAGHLARRNDSDERFAHVCLQSFDANERGRARRLIPTDREFDVGANQPMFALLAHRTAQILRRAERHPKSDELVWGLEGIVKARSLQDQLIAPGIWQQFLSQDALLRDLTRQIEHAQAQLERAVYDHQPEQAQAARATLEAIRRQHRERLEDIATESPIELGLVSSPVVHWTQVQALLSPDEMYIGLVSCAGDRYLRTQLTRSTRRFDSVDVPDLNFLARRQLAGEYLTYAEKSTLSDKAFDLLGLPSSGISTLVVCPDRELVGIQWDLLEESDTGNWLGDRISMGVVPAAGAFAHFRDRRNGHPPGTPRISYLGVSDVSGAGGSGALQHADREIERVRHRYFPRSSRCLTTGHGRELLDQRGHVGLLHAATHASAAGFEIDGTLVTPIDLAHMRLSADILLLTGCNLGAFGHDENNEFFGIVRQLLIATQAQAAVVSLARVPDAAGALFSDLVVSALTGQVERQLTASREPMNAGDAVRWARIRMRQIDTAEARQLLDGWVGELNPSREAWWTPWFVLGDPKARLSREDIGSD